MIEPLSIDRFHNLVAAYGADPQRWPVDLRGGAVCCLVASEAARMAWREAADLDADLDHVPGLEMSSDAVDRVLAIAGAPPRPNAGMVSRPLRYVLPYAAAAAIALVVGLSVPSPFRDAGARSPEIAATNSGPEIVEDASDNAGDLTQLALVDVSSFSDDESNTSTASDSENSLSELPLL